MKKGEGEGESWNDRVRFRFGSLAESWVGKNDGKKEENQDPLPAKRY